MSRIDPREAVLHKNVSVLHCDSHITLQETLLLLKDLPIHVRQVGAAAIAFPASEFELVRQALHKQGIFPPVEGSPVTDEDDNE